MATLADRIKALRNDRGWTLKQLSALCGISVSHLNAMERGSRPSPSFDYMVRLASAYGVSLDYFRADGEWANVASPSFRGAGESLLHLYDEETLKFISSETSLPYVSLAKRLAQESEDGQAIDPSSLLQVIAQFMRTRHAAYDGQPE